MAGSFESFKEKRVLVIGLGLSGQSAVRFLLKRGAVVVGTDHNPQIAADREICRLCDEGMAFVHEDGYLDLNLETAVQDGKVMQDFDLESLEADTPLFGRIILEPAVEDVSRIMHRVVV